ncbi:hypothetical protein N0V93_002299 [Gnomoniopsis smithogilvyi]|uniref:Metallo-beta-lactamase domain-containing protein n=1 Tax=Gnomoniopsis smithogilvyi TaxID=1191159 RepID=A0A9W8YV18_9PEZI|nr:hypothetical protein N0V93_002299 [Gnomoniopsis smithogilvyi]
MPHNRSLFNVPPGEVAKVSIIDSSARLGNLAASHLCKPPVEGFETFKTMPTWSFLIESPSGKKVLFDLGVHVDLTKYIPRTQNNIKKNGWDIVAKEHVADIIRRHGVDPKEIDSVIWSHSHFDHLGDITTFPPTTELVVGPGFKDVAGPGYPAKEDAPVTQEDLSARDVREITFPSQGPKVGEFPAHDFFGDGSFYLLDTPGHCIGHIAGLARTSKARQGSSDADTFILMGGDLTHHGGEIRPSKYLPLPEELPSEVVGEKGVSGAVFRDLNVRRGRKADQAFVDPVLFVDEKLSDQTIERAQMADADPNVWYVMAHDTALFEGVDLFPEQANDWKAKGWKEETMWRFLEDFLPAVSGR